MSNVELDIQRFYSCRGVSFEMSPSKATPIALPSAAPKEEQDGRWVWIPWASRSSSTRVLPLFQRSASRPSSHFCDLDLDEDEQHEEEEALEQVLEKVVDLEKQQKAKKTRLSVILLDQGLFTVYKRLFAVCLAVNLVVLALAATGVFEYAKMRAAAFAIGNVLILVLCRSEAVLRVVFWLAVEALGHGWVPLRLKTAATAFLQSLGGVHSGCGISSIAWLIYAIVLTLKDRDNSTKELIALACTILALLCISSMAAFPLLRHLHHNVFERTHRFAGWAALLFLWLFVLFTISYNPAIKSYENPRSKLATSQEFWLTLAITILIILPWLTVRQIDATVTAASGHASLIKFAGGVKAGILGRISKNPLSEWHAFGIISDGKTDHMMLAGAVGDFTKGLVTDLPRRLWVRQVHFAGLPYLVNMYKRVVLVATGSGICVFLSFLLQPCKADVCLIWVAKGIEQNFGKEIMEMMSGYPEEKVVVHDTAVLGRPNVGQMSVEAARRWAAEVVVVTSNPEGSRDVVTACKAAGIPAFGPIWDS